MAIAVIGLGGWAIVKGIDAEPSVVGSLATALAAVLAVVFGQQRAQRIELQQAHREELRPVYRELIDRFRGATSAPEDDDFFEDLTGKLLMNGSDGVIRAWVDFRRTTVDTDDEVNVEQMLEWEKVLRAIRKDLGHSGSDLEPGDLLRVYINDLDDYLPGQRRR